MSIFPGSILTPDQKRQLTRLIQRQRQGNLDRALSADEKVRRDLPSKYIANVGDGSTTSFVLEHNLKTYDVHVQVRQRTGSRTFITSGFTVDADSVNSVTVTFSSAPTTDQYRVIVIG